MSTARNRAYLRYPRYHLHTLRRLRIRTLMLTPTRRLVLNAIVRISEFQSVIRGPL